MMRRERLVDVSFVWGSIADFGVDCFYHELRK
jgi:hypothetical protein